MAHPRGVRADERGQSIAVSDTTSVTAEADRTYRGGLMPAAFVRNQWGRWVKKIFSIWQTEVDCMASNTRNRQRWRHVLVRQQQSQQQSSGEPHLKAGGSSAGVFLFDVARALRHGLLIPVMLVLYWLRLRWSGGSVVWYAPAVSSSVGKPEECCRQKLRGARRSPPAANGQAKLEHSGIHKQK